MGKHSRSKRLVTSIGLPILPQRDNVNYPITVVAVAPPSPKPSKRPASAGLLLTLLCISSVAVRYLRGFCSATPHQSSEGRCYGRSLALTEFRAYPGSTTNSRS